MPEPAKKPFAGYVRVSSVGGRSGTSFISPDVQEKTIRRLAGAHGLEVSEVVQELDVSGGKPVDERRLGALVRGVEAGDLAGIVTWKLSRFSRDLLDGVQVADRITRAGGRLLCDDYDSAQPMGKAILGLLLGFAQEEREARKSGWRAAQERSVARGVYPARAPIGYTVIKEPGPTKGQLVPDPEMAELVGKAFRGRAQGASLQECGDLLGISYSGARGMFKSRTYLGEAQLGDIFKEGAHEPLIDERTWQLAQRDSEAPSPRNGRVASQGVLAGLVRCEGCGYTCSVTGHGKKGIISYSCRGRRIGAVCERRASISLPRLDAHVWPMLKERAGSVDLEAALVEFFDASQRFSAADAELKAFLEGASIVALGPELYAAEVTRRREALQVASREWGEAVDQQDALNASEGIDSRRELARRLLERVVLRKASGQGRHDPVESRIELVWK